MTDRLVNFSKFFLNLPVNLQDEFSEYLKSIPGISLVVQRSVIDLESLPKLKERVAYDYAREVISLNLKTAIEKALDGVLARG